MNSWMDCRLKWMLFDKFRQVFVLNIGLVRVCVCIVELKIVRSTCTSWAYIVCIHIDGNVIILSIPVKQMGTYVCIFSCVICLHALIQIDRQTDRRSLVQSFSILLWHNFSLYRTLLIHIDTKFREWWRVYLELIVAIHM